jgi:hypothetical protein
MEPFFVRSGHYLSTIKTAILATFCYFCLPVACLAEPLISLGNLALSMASQDNSRHPKNFFRVTIGVQVFLFQPVLKCIATNVSRRDNPSR